MTSLPYAFIILYPYRALFLTVLFAGATGAAPTAGTAFSVPVNLPNRISRIDRDSNYNNCSNHFYSFPDFTVSIFYMSITTRLQQGWL